MLTRSIEIPVVSQNIVASLKGSKAKLKTLKATPVNMMVVGLGRNNDVAELII
jgi:hypothetical protein